MKKLCIVVIALLCSGLTFAQDTETQENTIERSHEVKVNGLSFIIGAVDVSYEYLLNEESGVGLTLFVPFDGDVADDINFYASPYYRFYFGKKYAAGFFLEGFGMLNSTNDIIRGGFFGEGEVIEVIENDIIDFALGIGLGGKWVTNGGFVGELSLGVGRNLFNNSDTGNEYIGKVGITLGYRF